MLDKNNIYNIWKLEIYLTNKFDIFITSKAIRGGSMLFNQDLLFEAKMNQERLIRDSENFRKIVEAKKEARRLKKECCREVKLGKRKKKRFFGQGTGVLENSSTISA